jgi:DNA-binding CsgD family transcriptional regulator
MCEKAILIVLINQTGVVNIKLMSKVSSNKQIAEELFISIETIKTHLKNI